MNIRIKLSSLHQCQDFLLYFFCGFPFLYLIRFPTDIQPYAMVYAVAYLIFQKKFYMPKLCRLTLYVCLFSGTLVLLALPSAGNSTDVLLIFREWSNYFSIFAITTAFYNSLLKTGGIKEKWVKFIIIVWFLVGFIQLTINKSFMGSLVSGMRTTADRGVNGLASEPSFYGYMMIFFGIIASKFKSNRLLFQVLCLIQIVLFAQSAVTIVYLVVFLFIYIFVSIFKNRKVGFYSLLKAIIYLLVSVLLFYLLFSYVINNLSDSRMVRLIRSIIQNFDSLHSLKDIYAFDGSVGDRVAGIYYPIASFFDNYFLPHGYSSSYRFISGYGQALFELGFVGAFLIAFLTKGIQRGFQNWTVTLGLFVMMFSAIQLISPLYAVVVGYSIYLADNNVSNVSDGYQLEET